MNSLFQQTESDSATGAFPASVANGIVEHFETDAVSAKFHNPEQLSSTIMNNIVHDCGTKPWATLETITPALAVEWLTRNLTNRRLRPRLIEAYARDMSNGNWQITNEAIGFDVDNELCDGQNRLNAIIASNVTIESFVVRGLPKKTKKVINTGKSRTPSDILKISGYANAERLAPSLRNLIAIKTGFVNVPQLTTTEMEALASRHPQIQNSLTFCYPSQVVSPSILAAVHYAAVLSDFNEKADEFATLMIEGLCSEPTNPAYRWRELLNKMKGQRQVLLSLQLLGTVSAWHHFYKGTSIRTFKLPSKLYIDTFDLDKI